MNKSLEKWISLIHPLKLPKIQTPQYNNTLLEPSEVASKFLHPAELLFFTLYLKTNRGG